MFSPLSLPLSFLSPFSSLTAILEGLDSLLSTCSSHPILTAILEVVDFFFPSAKTISPPSSLSVLAPALAPAAPAGLKFTFGVELECVFAFHESLLTDHLKSINSGTTIVKDLTDEMRLDFRRCHIKYFPTRPMYMGWGLTSDVPRLASGEVTPIGLRLKKFQCRPYADEILQLVLPLLPPGTDVQSIVYQGKRETFSQWHICEDTSIMGADKKTLLANLGDRIDEAESWDSHGIEMVSRVLEPSPAAFEEIGNYLTALRGNSASRHGALITDHCGMHVHIGLPPPPNAKDGDALPSFDLPTIQHLSYLLVMYEQEFSSLHPTSRHESDMGYGADIVSNLDDFYADMESRIVCDDDPWDEELDGPWDEASQAARCLPTPPTQPEFTYYGLSFSRVREMIFAPDMTMTNLVHMMCGSIKGRIVNYQYLLRDEHKARTIEFRQHAGCLQEADVRHWVQLLMKLVNKAHTMSQTVGVVLGEGDGWNGEGYPIVEDKRARGGVEEMLTVLEVDEEARSYWIKRSEAYAA